MSYLLSMKSVGQAGEEIRASVRRFGATVAVGEAPTINYGHVTIHWPNGATRAERHEQARAVPCFLLHSTESNPDGGCTSRGVVDCR